MPVTAIEVNEAASRGRYPQSCVSFSAVFLSSVVEAPHTRARLPSCAPVSDRNAAAIGLVVDSPWPAVGAAGHENRPPKNLSQKIQKSSKSVLTVRVGADYIRLTNEGGAPLATKKFASEI
ncbi:hypothetical protein, partial [Mesorhizobium sp.]|uniref:hypothetical protein n=1 Tax=Mesorhizobium sp. TaxID=1871066 RepID=UPI0025E9BF6D